jgi:predicted molibdopterin-dependent oxidoreductase YjgC
MSAPAPIRFEFSGRPLEARAGETLAAALLRNGIRGFRGAVGDAGPRGPYCMMGVCFECQVRVDGLLLERACQIGVHEGMKVEVFASPAEAGA